jgi:hypothetical protein
MTHRLPDDICRCRDHDCPIKDTCLRWIQRDMGSQRLVSADSLFPFGAVSVVTGQCPSFLAAEDDA